MKCPERGDRLILGELEDLTDAPVIACKAAIEQWARESKTAKACASTGNWKAYHAEAARRDVCRFSIYYWKEGVENGLTELFQRALDEADYSILENEEV